MFLAVGAMSVLEDEMHRAVHTVAHAIERANRRLCPYHDARVEYGDRRAKELELAGHLDAQLAGAG